MRNAKMRTERTYLASASRVVEVEVGKGVSGPLDRTLMDPLAAAAVAAGVQ